MKNTDIIKIRQLHNTVRDMIKCPHAKHVDTCDFYKMTKLLDEALALLLCPTCNDRYKQIAEGSPCPDCQKKSIDE